MVGSAIRISRENFPFQPGKDDPTAWNISKSFRRNKLCGREGTSPPFFAGTCFPRQTTRTSRTCRTGNRFSRFPVLPNDILLESEDGSLNRNGAIGASVGANAATGAIVVDLGLVVDNINGVTRASGFAFAATGAEIFVYCGWHRSFSFSRVHATSRDLPDPLSLPHQDSCLTRKNSLMGYPYGPYSNLTSIVRSRKKSRGPL